LFWSARRWGFLVLNERCETKGGAIFLAQQRYLSPALIVEPVLLIPLKHSKRESSRARSGFFSSV